MTETEVPKNRTSDLLSAGEELAGSAAKSASGLFAAEPVSAEGAVSVTLLTKVFEIATDVSDRHLSQREKVKTGAGLAVALHKIAQYLKAGIKARSDGFFDADETGRSLSDEILEGMLLKCKNEPEEKKIKLIGNIYANVAFMPQVSVANANWLLQKAQELTFRQLCMISLIEQKRPGGASWGPQDGDPAFEMEYKQIDDMLQRDSSSLAIKHEQVIGENRRIVGLSRAGLLIYEVMGLDEVSKEDLGQLEPRFPRAFD